MANRISNNSLLPDREPTTRLATDSRDRSWRHERGAASRLIVDEIGVGESGLRMTDANAEPRILAAAA